MVGSRRCHSRGTRSAGEAREGGAVPPLVKRRSERNVGSVTESLIQAKSRLMANKKVDSPRPALFAMQPITLKKIVPRNRQMKEAASTPRRSPRIVSKEGKENICQKVTKDKSPSGNNAKTESEPGPQTYPLKAERPQSREDVLSPVSTNNGDSPQDSERDLSMAKRVRRSYSRLEVSFTRSFLERQSPGFGLLDTSTPDHGLAKRQTLFGFEKLLVAGSEEDVPVPHANATQKMTATEPNPLSQLDTNIPGISFIKEKRKKKKMPQFNETELDEWVTQMNTEFDEAEKFDLLVE